MALIPMWKCDRDGTLFDDKKKAEEHDKMLELAANISYWLEQEVKDLDEDTSEAIGLLMAEHKDRLLKAIKGKPEILLEKPETEAKSEDNVTAISA